MNVRMNGLQPVDAIPARAGRASIWLPVLKEFLVSGHAFARLDLDGRSAISVIAQISLTARQHHLPLKVHKRGAEVYLARSTRRVSA